ncbi:hypothetical protein Tco_0791626 [Tanacetum coccineum]
MLIIAALIDSLKETTRCDVVHDEIHHQSEEEDVEPRRSKRARIKKSFGPDFVSFMVESKPNTYREAVTSLEGPQWKEAIKSEIDSILHNHEWELVDLPSGCKPLAYRWIFKKKMKANGTIDKYKARLVIKAIRNLEIHQMDVKTTFLNRDLEEEIYMEQPEGFTGPGQEGKVCKFVKSLYRLKQAPKQWHQKFDHVMLEYEMLIVGSNDKMIQYTKGMLKSRMDDPNMTMEEYIKLGEEKARSSVEAEFTAIVINDAFAPQDALQCKSQEAYELEAVHLSLGIIQGGDADDWVWCLLGWERQTNPRQEGLRDYWMRISYNGDFLGTTPFYIVIRDPILRLCHRLIACSIARRSQAPDKVTIKDLFYLKGMDVGSVNVPYLLARYLRLFAAGRKSEAHISEGLFLLGLATIIGSYVEILRE